MPDPQEVEAAQSATIAEAPETKKKTRRPRKAKAEPKAPVRTSGAKAAEAPAGAVRIGRKVYSAKERAQLLGEIEQSISRGESIRSAVKRAGISEQTYYHWKKAAAPVSESNDLKDLLALEDENKRLKSLLAERLRKENAELRKKLGLD